MRKLYKPNDQICWDTTNSYGLDISRSYRNTIIQDYFWWKQFVDPREFAVVTLNGHVIALVDEKELMPFVIDPTDEPEKCTTITEDNETASKMSK
jgi:hypothetical protein